VTRPTLLRRSAPPGTPRPNGGDELAGKGRPVDELAGRIAECSEELALLDVADSGKSAVRYAIRHREGDPRRSDTSPGSWRGEGRYAPVDSRTRWLTPGASPTAWSTDHGLQLTRFMFAAGKCAAPLQLGETRVEAVRAHKA